MSRFENARYIVCKTRYIDAKKGIDVAGCLFFYFCVNFEGRVMLGCEKKALPLHEITEILPATDMMKYEGGNAMMPLLSPQRLLQGQNGGYALALHGAPTVSQYDNAAECSGYVAFEEATLGVGVFVEKSNIGFCVDAMAFSLANSVVYFLHSTLANDAFVGKFVPFLGR